MHSGVMDIYKNQDSADVSKYHL